MNDFIFIVHKVVVLESPYTLIPSEVTTSCRLRTVGRLADKASRRKRAVSSGNRRGTSSLRQYLAEMPAQWLDLFQYELCGVITPATGIPLLTRCELTLG